MTRSSSLTLATRAASRWRSTRNWPSATRNLRMTGSCRASRSGHTAGYFAPGGANLNRGPKESGDRLQAARQRQLVVRLLGELQAFGQQLARLNSIPLTERKPRKGRE